MVKYKNESRLIQHEICFEILLKSIEGTPITIFDLILLILSAIFFVFLLLHCRKLIIHRIINSSSIINVFYILLCFACGLKVLRSLIAIVIISKYKLIVDKILWLTVRFFLLSIEMCIITFAVATAKLDSRTGIILVLIVSSLISLTYTSVQAALEFALPDDRFNNGKSNNNTIYGHGGTIFYSASAFVLFIIYLSILLFPLTPMKRRLRLPTKKMFYIYCAILTVYYVVEVTGGLLLYFANYYGLCVMNVASFVYFGFYDPLIYVTFLHRYFKTRKVLTFQSDLYASGNCDQSSDGTKSYSSVNVSTNYNYRPQQRSYSINDRSVAAVADPSGSDLEDEGIEHSTHFYPDNYVVMDRNTNIAQLMDDYYILPEGARMDYNSRPGSSTFGSEVSTAADMQSNIISLSYDPDALRIRGSWNMDDFADK